MKTLGEGTAQKQGSKLTFVILTIVEFAMTGSGSRSGVQWRRWVQRSITARGKTRKQERCFESVKRRFSVITDQSQLLGIQAEQRAAEPQALASCIL